MEITGLFSSFSAKGLFSSASRGDLRPTESSDRGEALQRLPGARRAGFNGQALGIFRQELRAALRAQFNAKMEATDKPYTRGAEPATPADVADETLRAARQLVAEAPTSAAQSLVSFRARVQQTASYVRQTVGAGDDLGDVDNAVAGVESGLDALENEVAGYRESTAAVLSVDSRTREQSTIRIRTQEGDVVRLRLTRKDSLSASAVSGSRDGGTEATTEIELSSRSRMKLKVKGDLNEAELAAIRNVFARAEQIADDFFGGDMAQAFSLAGGFDFDTEQLARVNMHFGLRQHTEISYTESFLIGPPAVENLPPSSEIESPAPPAGQLPPAELPPVSADEPLIAPPVADIPEVIPLSDVTEDGDQSVVTGPGDGGALDTASALESFFDALGAFLRSVSEGFSLGEGSGGSASFTYHYSESFKLTLLNAVIQTVAPEDGLEAAGNAGALLDAVSEQTQVSGVGATSTPFSSQ